MAPGSCEVPELHPRDGYAELRGEPCSWGDRGLNLRGLWLGSKATLPHGEPCMLGVPTPNRRVLPSSTSSTSRGKELNRRVLFRSLLPSDGVALGLETEEGLRESSGGWGRALMSPLRGLNASTSLLSPRKDSAEESMWALQAAPARTFLAVRGGKHCGPQTCTRLNHVALGTCLPTNGPLAMS